MSLISFAGVTLCSLVLLLFLPVLPPATVLVVIALTSLLLLRTPYPVLWLAAISGLVFCLGVTVARQQLNMIDRLTLAPLQAEVTVTATEMNRQRIQVKIPELSGQPLFPVLSAWLFTGESVTEFCPGQRWSMRLRLRPVHSQLNEGGYDQQRYALANYLPLQGKILAKEPLLPACSLRSRIISAVVNKTTGSGSQGVIQALLFGIRSNIPPRVSQLFRDTGIAHLMAISGMHIGLVASFGWLVVRNIQRLLPARYMTQLIPYGCSWLLAAGYSWLSGAQPPAMRAMLAMTLWLVIKLLHLNLNSWQVWLCCAGILLLSDPMLVLSDSFWLSMLAVLMLLIWFRWFSLPARYVRGRRWCVVQLLHLQVGMMILMLPLQALLFGGVSFSALPSNLLAIPVISLITLPLCGIALLLLPAGISDPFWWLADKSIAILTGVLEAQPVAWFAITDIYLWGPLVWGGLIFFRTGWYHHYKLHALVVMFCCFLSRNPARNEQWRVDMLDVGHGLSVVISQGNEAIIYDTGNRWKVSNAGERILVPWLLLHQLRIQQVIISHHHLDHYGGLSGLKKRWPGLPVRTASARPEHLSCFRGDQWQWKKLTFKVLWPPAGRTSGQNNDSCVLMVSDGSRRLLLTGDLERRAEMEMVALEKENLRATFIQVPHHGSNTSSSPALLRQVRGEVAIASLARYNAWKMPSPKVIARYRNAGFRWLDTPLSGQISLRINRDSYQVLEMREQIFPRWYHQWFGVKPESG